MNKRIKKKRELENSLRIAARAIDSLIVENNKLRKAVYDLEEINSQNVINFNKRLEEIEKAQKLWVGDVADIRQDVNRLKKTQKKSWFSRK